jgi:shikimate kinase
LDEPAPAGRHIVLVGMMGSGKTTLGRQLAARLGRRFVDLDAELENRSGRSVRSWFAEEGEEAFRDAEAGVLGDVLAGTAPVVAAAGGGVVCRRVNRERLRGGDVAVVWLDAAPSFLAARLAAANAAGHRPLLDGDPAAVLQRLDADRRGWYEQVADVAVAVDEIAHRRGDASGGSLADVVLDELRRRGLTPAGAAP